jgi:hypothetical protein
MWGAQRTLTVGLGKQENQEKPEFSIQHNPIKRCCFLPIQTRLCLAQPNAIGRGVWMGKTQRVGRIMNGSQLPAGQDLITLGGKSIIPSGGR